MYANDHLVESLISLAIEEDVGTGDLTSNSCIGAKVMASAKIIAREPLVMCGHEIARAVMRKIDNSVLYQEVAEEGSELIENDILATLSGSFRSILTAERTILNFLQRMSGIASDAREVVSLVGDTKATIVDTRKTTPGWRALEKYSVKVGGALNHRHGLYDAVLIKNNHIDALDGDVQSAIDRCRSASPAGTFVQVEVRNRDELKKALASSPDSVLLDNMNDEELADSVAFVASNFVGMRPLTEASGGITRERVAAVAQTGVDRISMGSLTHSANAVDMSLRFFEHE